MQGKPFEGFIFLRTNNKDLLNNELCHYEQLCHYVRSFIQFMCQIFVLVGTPITIPKTRSFAKLLGIMTSKDFENDLP